MYPTLVSDTSNVVVTTIENTDVARNATGTAKVTIVSGNKVARGTFAPNQIFVSVDLDNGGVGFGSATANFPLPPFEPAYPLGIQGGTIYGTTGGASYPSEPFDELAVATDLQSDAAFGGRAWGGVGPTRATSTSISPTCSSRRRWTRSARGS